MSDLNKVLIIGRLVRDPELKYLASGSAVANIQVATGESWKDKQTGDTKSITEFHNVAVFGKLAEICGQYLVKSSQVYFEGKLRTDKWEDKEGVTKYKTSIIANEMIMLGSKGDKKPSDRPAPSAAPEEMDFETDVPF